MKRLLDLAAASVDADPALLPVFDRLFQGLRNLGSSPRLVASLLPAAGAAPSWRVLDLGCGKGGPAVHLARTIGCRVLGVDAVVPFVEDARRHARRAGVADRTEFVVGDARRHAARPRAHAVLVLGVAPLEHAIRWIARSIRPGGLAVIDDAIAFDPSLSPEIPTRAQASAMLERVARIERAIMPAPSRVDRSNRALLSRLERGARAVARERPDLRPALARFIESQRAANLELATRLRPIVFLARWR